MKNPLLPADYQSPFLTIECLLFAVVEEKLCIFIGQITGGPHDRQWAIPGGFCHKGETTYQALERIMCEKCGIAVDQLGLLEQLYAFDNPAGEAGQHVSIVFLGGGYKVDYSTDYMRAHPAFTSLAELPELAYLQGRVVERGITQLRTLLATTTAAASLLPPEFTLTALQQVYELVLDMQLDKRNFRKKFLSYDVLEDTGKMDTGNAYRPAKLYRFVHSDLQPLHQAF